jgi:LysM repeat protein
LRRQVDFLHSQALAHVPAPATNVVSSSPPVQGSVGGPERTVISSTTDRGNAALAGSRKHTVKDRETMASIARLYRIRVESIMAANPAVQPKRLRAGQALTIPAS